MAKQEDQIDFNWDGFDRQNKKTKGTISAKSEVIARAELRRMGIRVVGIKAKAKPLFGAKVQKITPGDIAVFARQLATMLAAGVPLVQSFDIIGKGHDNASMSELLLGIKADVEGGDTLAQALNRKPLYFDALFCNLVEAGEHAGVLETLLDKIATYKEKTESIKKKVKKALTYPIAVLVVAFIVTAILLIFVVPVFEDLFKGFGADLPAFTQFVIELSAWVQEWWWAIFGSIGGGLWFFFYTWKRSEKMQGIMDRLLLKVPVFGDLIKKSSIARWTRTLSTMFAAGVPLVDALDSVGGAAGNYVYTQATMQIQAEVSTGSSLTAAMEASGVFPPMVTQMVAIGEESGQLDTMLGKTADFFEAEVDDAVEALSSLMEPLIMVFLGGLIGGLVVAMYLPIFKLGSVVG